MPRRINPLLARAIPVVLLIVLLAVPGNSVLTSPSPRSVTLGAGSSSLAGLSSPFAPVQYPVTFQERGLPAGTNWTVVLNGSATYSLGSFASFSVPNGSYSYHLPVVAGFTPSPSSGRVLVTGTPVLTTIHFLPAAVQNTLSLFNNTLLPANATAQSGSQPFASAFDAATGTLFVDDYATSNVAMVNTTTRSVTGYVPLVGLPCGIAYDSTNGFLYASVLTNGALAAVNGTTGSVTGYLHVGKSPCAVAYDPVNDKIYVTNTESNSVVVVNPSSFSVTATVAVGNVPRALAVDTVTGNVYAVSMNGNKLVEISGATNTVLANTTTLPSPDAIAYDAHTTNLYVASFNDSTVTVYAVATLKAVGNVSVGSKPFALAYEPSNFAVYSANYFSDNVSAISGLTLAATLTAGANPEGVAVDASGNVYVANRGSSNLTLLAAATNKVIGSIPVGWSPSAVAYDPLATAFVVANQVTDTLSVVSTSTGRSVGTVPVGSGPGALLYDGVDHLLFVANTRSDNLTVLNPTTFAPVASLPVGSDPVALAYDTANARLYVANSLSGNLSIIDPATPSVVGSLATGGSPGALLADPLNGLLYAVGVSAQNLTAYNVTSGKVAGTVAVGSFPSGIAMDPSTGFLYVANYASNSVTVVNGTDNTVVSSFSAGSEPAAIAFDAETRGVEVVDFASNSLAIYSTETQTLVGLLPLNNSGPVAEDLSPSTGMVAVADQLSGALSLVHLQVLPAVFPVSFTESGLPSGTNWSVTVNGTSSFSVGPAIRFSLVNGSYFYTVAPVPGFVSTPTSGDLSVNGTILTVPVSFTRVILHYTVSFTELGLPAGTNWSVSVNGSTQGSNTTSISFLLPNGNYPYSVGSSLGYGPSPRSGTLTVLDGPVTQIVEFQLPVYNITFQEKGLPANTSWSVALNGSAATSRTSAIAFANGSAQPNGTYPFHIDSLPGYVPEPAAGNVIVNGSSRVVSVTFVQMTYSVTFSATNLPSPKNWSVTMDGTTRYSTTATLQFFLPNGTYDYTVGKLKGYDRLPAGGAIVVNGHAQYLVIKFLTPPPSGFTGLIESPAFYAALATAAVVAVVFLYFVRKKKKKAATAAEETESEDESEELTPNETTKE